MKLRTATIFTLSALGIFLAIAPPVQAQTTPDLGNLGNSGNLAIANNIQRLVNTRECAGCNLRGANLQNLDLKGANLSRALLEDAQLQNTDLTAANLESASLGSADLSKTNLSAANLAQADLCFSILKGVKTSYQYQVNRKSYQSKT